MSERLIDQNDPARQEIVKRAMKLNITGDPDKAAHALGKITLADGREVTAHVVHAADAVIKIDDIDAVIMIKRSNEPDIGKDAFPGGFIDPKEDGSAETTVESATREAKEEASVDLINIKGTPIGRRRMSRPFDVRVAKGNGLKENYGIADGDIFMVSTQAVLFHLPSLKGIRVEAKDDAKPGSARPVRLDSIKRERVAADHYDLLVEALPGSFKKKNTPRSQSKPKP